ncbi:MAG: sulfite exporter TauE/SafE family protein [Ignavibacteriales bacterium]|nr:sulfite exporter TauE/SafE family protein [Ignavibacteriales bacterium]
MDIAILLLIGLAAGILSGFLGVGGGIIIIPALVALLGFSQKQAQGTSIGFLLLPIGILAVLNYYKAGLVDLRAVGIMTITFVIGSYFSSKAAIDLPEYWLKKGFAVLLLFYAIKLFLEK